ncbi:MAG: hypothetical protein K5888_05180 [Lachnospiraceae bacterium]|nr:hypothetical protein [Lachnospiraceae bacterium]
MDEPTVTDSQDAPEEASEVNELENAASDLEDSISDAQDFADAADNTVDNANEEAEELLTTVENTKDQDVAKEAVAKLRAAEQKYNDSIGKAGADIEQAKIELEKAEENVATLETALNEAKEELAEENKAANIIKSAENSLKADWTTQGKFLETFLINDYIPQLIDPDAEGITITRNKGFNGQESTRYIATYTDNKHESHTKYFNYNRINRTYSDEDMWANLGNSKDIVIYEKTEEEVEADKYLDNYCKKNHINLGDKNASSKVEGSFKNRVNSGEFDVFAYDDNGHTAFKVRDEIN